MEKIINNLSELQGYHNRQVVINQYLEDDFLTKREGFDFLTLRILNGNILFTKKDGNCYSLSIHKYRESYKDGQFPNYFIFKNTNERLEIYFP